MPPYFPSQLLLYTIYITGCKISRIAKDLRLRSVTKYCPNKIFPLDRCLSCRQTSWHFCDLTGEIGEILHSLISQVTVEGLWDRAAAGNEPWPMGLLWNVFCCQPAAGLYTEQGEHGTKLPNQGTEMGKRIWVSCPSPGIWLVHGSFLFKSLVFPGGQTNPIPTKRKGLGTGYIMETCC